jgi:hypothetical protein
MTTPDIIREITNYAENTILFRPNLTPHGLGTPTQLTRTLKIDISNSKLTDPDNYKLYELQDVEQAYGIIAGVYQKSKEDIKMEVDSFLQKQEVNAVEPLYLVAYLVEAKEDD